jgi:GNAT superfamily N-acetyltransferase
VPDVPVSDRPDGPGRHPVVVRPFRPEDADAVAEALVDSSIHHVELDPQRYRPLDGATIAAEYRAGRTYRGERGAETVTLVAEVDGRVVGMADVRIAYPGGSHRPDRYGLVEELAVREADRRRGAGTALLDAAEDWARRHGCRYAVLDYNAANVEAERFYRERMGYRPAGVIVIKDL